jgi:hypothetical protein
MMFQRIDCTFPPERSAPLLLFLLAWTLLGLLLLPMFFDMLRIVIFDTVERDRYDPNTIFDVISVFFYQIIFRQV